MSDRAPRKRTLTCTSEERLEFADTILRVEGAIHLQDMVCQLIEADFFEIAAFLPKRVVGLLILDPPYNLTKDFHGRRLVSPAHLTVNPAVLDQESCHT